MTTVWIASREWVAHLQRLAVVFAAPLRLRIVTELYQREMSPTEFYVEFGGGSVSRVAKHFDRLEETGWLRLMHTRGPGGRRRGATEHVYRATEPALCDEETWAALPYSVRLAFSWNIFVEIAGYARRAMEAPIRPDYPVTGTRLILDEVGRERVAAAVAQEMAAQLEEQEDARRRVAHTGEDLFSFSALLLASEVPLVEGLRVGPVLVAGDDLMIPFPVRISKVFEDEICLQLIDEANRGEMSVPTFYAKYGKRFGLDKPTIQRRIGKLIKYGWLKVVREETGGRRRGATEKFYRATGPALYDGGANGPWADPPHHLTEADDWQAFTQLSDWVKTAMAAGTAPRRDDTCLAWTIIRLDQQGREKVVASLVKLQAFVLREQEEAEARLMRSGEEPVGMMIGLGAYESPAPLKEP